MRFERPRRGKKNKPDLDWVWEQNLYLHELKDAIGQRWYGTYVEDSPRSINKILDELNAIANFNITAETLFKYSNSREQSLRIELDQRKEYDKQKRKEKRNDDINRSRK